MGRLAGIILAGVVSLLGTGAVEAETSARVLAKEAFYEIEADPFSQDAMQGAVSKIQRAKESDSEEPWVHIAASRILLEVGYRSGSRFSRKSFDPVALRKAERFAKTAVASGADLGMSYVQKARLQMINGDLRGAWNTLNRAYQLDPDSFYPWYLRSQIALEMNDAERAEKNIDEAETLSNKRYQRRWILAIRKDIARLGGDDKAVEQYYRAIIQHEPDSPHAYGNYGAFLLGQDRYREAITQLEKAISISPYPTAVKQLKEARQKLAAEGR